MNLLLELINLLELKGETTGLKLAPFKLDIDRKVIITKIGDKEYEFTPKEKNVAELFNSVTGVAKHSPGRALVYLKQHATGVPVKESLITAQLVGMSWKRYISNLSAPTDVDALSETIDAIYDAIDRHGPGAVNLATLQPAVVNGEHLAAVLRATYAFKNQIIGWERAREMAILALQKANIEIDDALAGLV